MCHVYNMLKNNNNKMKTESLARFQYWKRWCVLRVLGALLCNYTVNNENVILDRSFSVDLAISLLYGWWNGFSRQYISWCNKNKWRFLLVDVCLTFKHYRSESTEICSKLHFWGHTVHQSFINWPYSRSLCTMKMHVLGQMA